MQKTKIFSKKILMVNSFNYLFFVFKLKNKITIIILKGGFTTYSGRISGLRNYIPTHRLYESVITTK